MTLAARHALERELAHERAKLVESGFPPRQAAARRRVAELERELGFCAPGERACDEPGAVFCGCELAGRSSSS